MSPECSTEVSVVPALAVEGYWLAVCSACRWVGKPYDTHHAAVTDGIDHMEASRG